jgi:hypothetical protein
LPVVEELKHNKKAGPERPVFAGCIIQTNSAAGFLYNIMTRHEISIRNPTGKCDHLFWPDITPHSVWAVWNEAGTDVLALALSEDDANRQAEAIDSGHVAEYFLALSKSIKPEK